jgi:hypothetical protein
LPSQHPSPPSNGSGGAVGILEQLPGQLEWLVLFRLSAIRTVVDEAMVRRMYFLPDTVRLDDFSHVILTSAGRFLARADPGHQLTSYGGEAPIGLSPGDASIRTRYAAELALLDLSNADCVGVGRKPDGPPAFLRVTLNGMEGQAVALFDHRPSGLHYDLLPAVGVELVAVERAGHFHTARFSNRLPIHAKAGALSGFGRTAHCNDFFLNHGEIDEPLLNGLVQASEDRTRWGRMVCGAVLEKLAKAAPTRPPTMTCCPPPPQASHAYGDLVPLGLLLRALETVPHEGNDDAFAALGRRLTVDALRRHLLDRRHNRLWPFHTGRLVTATDSALILLGLQDREAIEALEIFHTSADGYVPQLWSEHDEPDRMRVHPCNRHWRQADFATTCMIRGLRARARLPERTPLSVIESRFDRRSGLFFANPYLVDLCTALAIAEDPNARNLCKRLEREVIDSVNANGSFGRYDEPLSTALAILVLGTVGYRGRLLRLAQLRLVEHLESTDGWPVSTPFYSTFLLDRTEVARPGAREMEETTGAEETSGHLSVDGEVHEVSRYRDEHRVIFAAVAAMALNVPCELREPDPNLVEHAPAHPRYRCRDLDEYVAGFALPPYAANRRPAPAL